MKTKKVASQTLPSLAEVQEVLSELTGFPPSKFALDFKLLDCAGEIEALEQRFDVIITVRNFIKATVAEVIRGMSLPV